MERFRPARRKRRRQPRVLRAHLVVFNIAQIFLTAQQTAISVQSTVEVEVFDSQAADRLQVAWLRLSQASLDIHWLPHPSLNKPVAAATRAQSPQTMVAKVHGKMRIRVLLGSAAPRSSVP